MTDNQSSTPEDADDSAASQWVDPFTAEERATLTALEQKFGAIWPMRVDGFGLVVLRKPTKAEWKIYQRDLKDKNADQTKVEENLRRTCVAIPELNGYDNITAKFPALGDVFSNRIGALAGGMTADGSEALQDLGKDWKRPGATQ